MMKRLALVAAVLSMLPLSAQAQSSRCDNMPTEEEYQRCIERAGSKDKDFDIRDIGQGSIPNAPPQTTPPAPSDPVDSLPAASQRHVQKQMAKQVYAKVGEWTPETRNQDFDYEPSEAAQSDPELRAQEQAAFDKAVEQYHDREQKAYEERQGGGEGKEQTAGKESGGGETGGEQTAGNTTVSGQTRETGSPGQGAGGLSRNVFDILGDLTGKGTGTGSGAGQQEQSGEAGETVTISGDVTIDRDAGSDGAGNAGQSASQTGQAGGNDGQASGAGQTASQGSEAGDGAGQTASQDSQVGDGTGQAGDGQLAAAGQGQDQGQTGQPAGAAGTQTQTASQEAADPAAPQQPAGSAGGEDAQSGPPPVPPRPIPSAEAIAAEMLAKLFGGEEQPEQSPFTDAPFEDWSDPDPSTAAQNQDALEEAAEAATAPPAQQPAQPSTDQATLDRQIEKEEARLALAQSTGGDTNQAEDRLDTLKAAQGEEGGTGSSGPGVSASAARRIAIMELP